MLKNMPKLRAALLVVVVILWMGHVVQPAVVQKAPVPETGQTQCWDASGNVIPCVGTGQDGEIGAGVPLPTPQFTDNRNGTVTDKLTGLIWLKDAVCPTLALNVTWDDALHAVRTLAAPQCDLSDGSKAGSWRLPNVRELYSLMDYGFANPSLSNRAGTAQWTEGDPFTHANGQFATSTTYPLDPRYAFVVSTAGGVIFVTTKIGGSI